MEEEEGVGVEEGGEKGGNDSGLEDGEDEDEEQGNETELEDEEEEEEDEEHEARNHGKVDQRASHSVPLGTHMYRSSSASRSLKWRRLLIPAWSYG